MAIDTAHEWVKGFFDYYQISGSDEEDETQSEPNGGGELKGYMDGLHSPFGYIWAVQKETGWTDEYILWHQSSLALRMKMADAPRYVRGERVTTVSDFGDL